MRCEKDAKMRRDAVRGADAFQGFCSSFKNRLFIYTTWLSIEKSTDIFIVQSDSSTSPTRGLFQPLPGCLSQVIVRVCCFLAAGCDTHDVQHLSHIHISDQQNQAPIPHAMAQPTLDQHGDILKDTPLSTQKSGRGSEQGGIGQ